MKTISLTQGMVSLVDDSMFELLNQFKWHATKSKNTWYAERNERTSMGHRTIRMHQMILAAEKGQQIDHIDGDGLNNQTYNLRVCTNTENSRNTKVAKNSTTGYKGVSWHKAAQKYMASIMVDRKHIYLGLFETVEEAAKAYNDAALNLHGPFARINEL